MMTIFILAWTAHKVRTITAMKILLRATYHIPNKSNVYVIYKHGVIYLKKTVPIKHTRQTSCFLSSF